MPQGVQGDGYPDHEGSWLARSRAFRGGQEVVRRAFKADVRDLQYRLLLAKTLYWEHRCKKAGIILPEN